MKSNFRELVLEHLEEHGEEVVNSPTTESVSKTIIGCGIGTTTYSCLPRIGANPLICVPKAARTCCELSDTRSSTLPIMSLSRVDRSTKAQNPGI